MKAGILRTRAEALRRQSLSVKMRRPAYRPRLDFFGVAERVGNEQLPYQMRLAVDRALATAR